MRTSIVTIALVLVASAAVVGASPSVTISSTTGAGALALDGGGSSTPRVVKIAEVELWTDDALGLAVSISSGTLSKADGSTPIAFQVVLVGRGAAAPLSSAFLTPSGMTYFWSRIGAGAVNRDLYIKYTPAPVQDPGAYTASVVLDVFGN